MSSRAIVFLAVPRMTRAFDVRVANEDASSAELQGREVSDLSTFLRLSRGQPRFDLEQGGRIFRECRLSSMRSDDSIPFTFERVRDVDASSGPTVAPEPAKRDG